MRGLKFHSLQRTISYIELSQLIQSRHFIDHERVQVSEYLLRLHDITDLNLVHVIPLRPDADERLFLS